MRLRFILFFPLAIILYACATQPRPLKPVRPTPLPTNPFSLVEPDPLQVTFAQIEANPTAYLGQLLRVEASYVTIEPQSCYPLQGPRFYWGLVADNLQMGARGYERIVELVPEGTPFTVNGVWRRYIGPSGCGKEPLVKTVYYLDVMDIVQPNPISRVIGAQIADVTALLPTIAPEGVVEPTVDLQQATLPPDSIIDVVTLAPNESYPSVILTLTPSPTRFLPTTTQRAIPTNTSPVARNTVTPSLIDTSTPTLIPTDTPVPTETSEGDSPIETDTPTATEPSETGTPQSTPTLFTRGTPTPTPDGTRTPTTTATGTPATATPASEVTGTPATITPTSTGTITPTVESEPTATPNGSGLATATTDPNATPVTLTTPGYPVPTSTPYP